MATMDPGGTDAGGQIPQQPTPIPQSSQQSIPINVDPTLQSKLQAIRDSLRTINDESEDFVEKLGEVSAEFSGLEDSVSQLEGKRKKAAASELADIDVILKARLDALSREDREQVKIEQDYQRRMSLQRSAAQREVARAIGERRPQSEIESIEAGYSTRMAGIARQEGSGMMDQMKAAASSIKDLFSSVSQSTPWQQAMKLGPATAQAQAAMYSAGLAGINGGAKLQGAVNAGVLTPEEAQQQVKTLANISPKVLTESTQSLNVFMGVLGKFGYSVEESMAALGDASARINMGTGNLIATELFAADIKTKLGMATREATEHIINMTEAARSGGAGIGLVATVLTGFDRNIKELGVTMSKAESARFTQNLASGLANMSMLNLVGLTAFKNGTGLPSNEQVRESMANPAGLLQNLFDKTIKGMPLATGIPALEKIASLAGVTFQGKQQELAAFDMLSKGGLAGLSAKEMQKYTAQPEQIAKLQTEGWETLKNMKNPIDRMNANLERIAGPLSLWLSRQLQTSTAQKVGTAIMGAGQVYNVGKAATGVGSGAIKGAQEAMSVAETASVAL